MKKELIIRMPKEVVEAMINQKAAIVPSLKDYNRNRVKRETRRRVFNDANIYR
jgi:flagellar biosynthesis/type III secretory pathway chaperone